MASLKTALASKAAQTAIRGKAGALVRAKTEQLKQEFKAKMARAKTAAKRDGRDILQMAVDPVLTGAGGAFALDLAFKPLSGIGPLKNGAAADVVKAAGAIGAGFYGRKLIKHPYFLHAMVGAAIVNTHRLATRVANRVQGGTLAGMFTDELGDMDLAATRDTIPVPVRLSDGRVVTARMDKAGNFFDMQGRPMPFAGAQQALAGADADAFETPDATGMGEYGYEAAGSY